MNRLRFMAGEIRLQMELRLLDLGLWDDHLDYPDRPKITTRIFVSGRGRQKRVRSSVTRTAGLEDGGLGTQIKECGQLEKTRKWILRASKKEWSHTTPSI